MDLKELLGEDLYNQVIAKAGDKKLAVVSDGNWMPRDKFNEVNDAKKKLEEDLKARDQQLSDLQKNAGDSASLKEQISKLQADNQAAAAKYEADMKEIRLNSAIKTSLIGHVHDPDIVSSLLDKTKIEIGEDGAVKGGLEDQIKSLRESKAFLFVQEDKTKGFRGFTPPNSAGGKGGGKEEENYGAILAKQKTESADSLEKARQSYFE